MSRLLLSPRHWGTLQSLSHSITVWVDVATRRITQLSRPLPHRPEPDGGWVGVEIPGDFAPLMERALSGEAVRYAARVEGSAVQYFGVCEAPRVWPDEPPTEVVFAVLVWDDLLALDLGTVQPVEAP